MLEHKDTNSPGIKEGKARGGSRQLLRRLRDIMATGEGTQDRLDRLVKIIAQEMHADVCSLYVRRAGDVLELFATEGLKSESVHQTRLRIGEGIVGDIAAYAKPFALADAQSHPHFAYRPETGEEIYHSLMGVPILRGGRVMGVLVIQNRKESDYSDESVELMETVAMVVAEVIAAGGVVRRREQAPVDGLALKPLRIDGVQLSTGLAMGRAVLHRPLVPIGKMVAEDEAHEQRRLDYALAAMHTKLDHMVKTVDDAGGGDHVDILKTYRMIAEDRGWIQRIRDAIGTGLTAEGAVVRVQNETRARMAKVQDTYLRERLLDLEDLAFRLLQHLQESNENGNGTFGPDQTDLPKDMIVVARNMGPAELLDYDRERLRGVVLEEGSSTAHVAIVARALDIPIVGRVNRILSRVEPQDRIIVDGNNAVCFVRPGEEFRRVFATSMELHQKRLAAYARDRDLPSVTLDGQEITLNMNAGLLIDMPHLHETGAKGIGLYRTEVPFMVRSEYPDVKIQSDLYAKVYEQAEGKRVVFRTLDIGGDKVLPYFQDQAEENPAMGWRAIRVALDRPAMLRQQLRAMIHAANGQPLAVMFPMISEVQELLDAKKALQKELDRTQQRGNPVPSELSVGIMFEVPSLAFQMEALLPHVDFISIGSNDLLQFFFASDRGNPRLDKRYEALSPAFLSLIGQIADKGNRAGIPVSVCGEIAGDPLHAMALVGLGVRHLSMTPRSIGPVRSMIRTLDAKALQSFMSGILTSPAHSLRNRLIAFAKDHKILL